MPRQPDTRFDPVAPIYARVRPPYPAALAERLLAANGGARYPRAVDLGCGTGLSLDVALAVADEVTGVEPADAMRREAAARHPTVPLVRAGAAETGLPDGCAELVTIATAFHWMDAPAVLAECARLLVPGGRLAIYHYDVPTARGPAGEVLARHLREHWQPYRSPRLERLAETPRRVEESPHFELVAEELLPNPVRWSAAEVALFQRSTSYVSALLAALGDEAAARYLAELERELAAAPQSLELAFDIALVLGRRRQAPSSTAAAAVGERVPDSDRPRS